MWDYSNVHRLPTWAHTHSHTPWLDLSIWKEYIRTVTDKVAVSFHCLTLAETQTQTNRQIDKCTLKPQAHTGCICFYSVVCLLEMLRGHELAFSQPLPAYMCGWFVCLHVSAHLSPYVCSSVCANMMRNDDRESRGCLRKARERQWETEGRKRGHNIS